MTNRVPRLSARLTLEAPQRVADGGGGWQVNWQALGTLWAELRPVHGREVVSGGRESARVTHRVTVRAAAEGSPRRPRPEQRFRQGGRLFAVRGIGVSDDGAYLTCWVEEGPFA